MIKNVFGKGLPELMVGVINMAKKRKTKRRAVRNPITGEVMHYTNTKTVGLRNPITGAIARRESKSTAKKRGLAMRTASPLDLVTSKPKKRKKKTRSFF